MRAPDERWICSMVAPACGERAVHKRKAGGAGSSGARACGGAARAAPCRSRCLRPRWRPAAWRRPAGRRWGCHLRQRQLVSTRARTNACCCRPLRLTGEGLVDPLGDPGGLQAQRCPGELIPQGAEGRARARMGDALRSRRSRRGPQGRTWRRCAGGGGGGGAAGGRQRVECERAVGYRSMKSVLRRAGACRWPYTRRSRPT
jgi:hypothetical protein